MSMTQAVGGQKSNNKGISVEEAKEDLSTKAKSFYQLATNGRLDTIWKKDSYSHPFKISTGSDTHRGRYIQIYDNGEKMGGRIYVDSEPVVWRVIDQRKNTLIGKPNYQVDHKTVLRTNSENYKEFITVVDLVTRGERYSGQQFCSETLDICYTDGRKNNKRPDYQKDLMKQRGNN